LSTAIVTCISAVLTCRRKKYNCAGAREELAYAAQDNGSIFLAAPPQNRVPNWCLYAQREYREAKAAAANDQSGEPKCRTW